MITSIIKVHSKTPKTILITRNAVRGLLVGFFFTMFYDIMDKRNALRQVF
jgi:hypothetical protein